MGRHRSTEPTPQRPSFWTQRLLGPIPAWVILAAILAAMAGGGLLLLKDESGSPNGSKQEEQAEEEMKAGSECEDFRNELADEIRKARGAERRIIALLEGISPDEPIAETVRALENAIGAGTKSRDRIRMMQPNAPAVLEADTVAIRASVHEFVAFAGRIVEDLDAGEPLDENAPAQLQALYDAQVKPGKLPRCE
jgi:hypothetical protein